MSHIRHLLYGDPVLPKYSKDMTMWMKYTKPFEDYLDMMIPQFEEVKTYYQRQKEEHDDLRKQKKVEKVECERCNAMVSRTNLSKHMATFRCRSGEQMSLRDIRQNRGDGKEEPQVLSKKCQECV